VVTRVGYTGLQELRCFSLQPSCSTLPTSSRRTTLNFSGECPPRLRDMRVDMCRKQVRCGGADEPADGVPHQPVQVHAGRGRRAAAHDAAQPLHQDRLCRLGRLHQDGVREGVGDEGGFPAQPARGL